MPAWSKRCIVPVKPQAATAKQECGDGSLSPARSDTVVASESRKPQLSAGMDAMRAAERMGTDNLPERAGARAVAGEGNADADDEAASSPPPPRNSAPHSSPAPALHAQEASPELKRKRSSAMETEPADASSPAEQRDAQQASTALAGTTLLILQQLYSVTPTPSDAMTNSWATTLSVPADEIRRWLAVQHAKDGIVRAPASKRRKVSHNRSSSDAATLSPAVSTATVKLESPTVATAGFGVASSPQEEAKSTVIGTNFADITQAPIAAPHGDSVSGTRATSTPAAPVPILLPPQPTTVNPSELHYASAGAIARPSSSHSTSSTTIQNQRPRVSVPAFPRPLSQAPSSASTPVAAQYPQLPSSRPQSANGSASPFGHANPSWPSQPHEHPQMREQRISRPRVDAAAPSHQMYPPALPAGQHPPGHPGPSYQPRRNSATSVTSISPATPTTAATPLFPNARPAPAQIPTDGSFVPSQQQVLQALANGMGVFYPPTVGAAPVQLPPAQRPQPAAPSQQQAAALHAAAQGMGVYYPPDTSTPLVQPPPPPPVQRAQQVVPPSAAHHAQPAQPSATALRPVPADAPRFIDQHGRECIKVGNDFFPIEYHPAPSQQQQPHPPMRHPVPSQYPAPAPGQHPHQRHAPPHPHPHPHQPPRHLVQPSVVVPSQSQGSQQPAPQQIQLVPSRNVTPSQAGPQQQRRSRRMMHNGFETRDPEELRLAPPAEQFEYCVRERQHWIDELETQAALTEPGYADDCKVRIRAVDAWVASLLQRGLIAQPVPRGYPGPTRPAGAYVQGAAVRPNAPQAVSARPPREVIVIPDTPPVPKPRLLEDDAGPSRPTTAVAPEAVTLSSQPVAPVPLPLPPQPADRAIAPRVQISNQPISREASVVPSPITIEEYMQQRDAVFAYLDACARTPPDVFVPPPALAFGGLASRGERRALVGPYVDEWRRLHMPSPQVLKQIQAHQRRALAPHSPETPAGQLPPSLPAVERELRRQNEVAMDEDDVADQTTLVQSHVEDDGSRALVLREVVNPSHGIVTPDATPEPAAKPAKEGLFKDLMLMLNDFERPRKLEADGMDATEHMRAVSRVHPRPEGTADIDTVEKLDEMLQSHIEKSNYVLAAIERGALAHLGFPPTTSNSVASSSSSPA